MTEKMQTAEELLRSAKLEELEYIERHMYAYAVDDAELMFNSILTYLKDIA